MYEVKLYINTGFNAVNIPYNVDVLEAAADRTITLPSIDILQHYYITSITVSGSGISGNFWDTIKNADYCKIGDMYYSIQSIVMTSMDVAALNILPDFWLSATSIGTVEAISGLTVRRRVTPEEDQFGAFCQEDPLIAPQLPLELVVHPHFNDNTSGSVVCESTIDLVALSNLFDEDFNFTGEDAQAVTFTDGTTGNKVTVPYVQGVKDNTIYPTEIAGVQTDSVGSKLYKVNNNRIKAAMSTLRSLGVESSILNQVIYPSYYVMITASENGEISSIRGNYIEEDSGIVINYTTVRNKRLLYGETRKVGIISMAGNKAEYNIEQVTKGENPYINISADPRPDGCPYFAFKTYMGMESKDFAYINAIKGLPWKNAPLVFTQKSGTALDRYQFENRMFSKSLAYAGAKVNQWVNYGTDSANFLSQSIGDIANFTGNIDNFGSFAGTNYLTYGGVENGRNLISKITNNSMGYLGNQTKNAFNMLQTRAAFEGEALREKNNFNISQNVVAPTIEFPLNNEFSRDFFGNNYLAYEYRFNPLDIERLDKILDLYGYATVERFSLNMLNNHTDYDYIQLSDLNISGNVPRWMTEGLTAQLSAGTRMWHIRPTVII